MVNKFLSIFQNADFKIFGFQEMLQSRKDCAQLAWKGNDEYLMSAVFVGAFISVSVYQRGELWRN